MLAVGVLAVEHLAHRQRVHGRVPRHVRHEDQERVEPVRIAARRVGDDGVHQPVRRERVLPRERVVDPHRRAVVLDRELVGAGGKAERRRVERRVRPDHVGRVEGAKVRRTMWRGYGALWRKPPGASIVPRTLIRIASARTVWKPFECAATPRIAWNATGRACVVACSLPQASVQAIGSSNAWCSAVVPSSRASARIRAASIPVIASAHSGVHGATRSRRSWNDGLTRVPSASAYCAFERRIGAVGDAFGIRRHDRSRRACRTRACCAARGRLPAAPSPDRGRARTCLRARPRRARRAAARWCSASGTRGRSGRSRSARAAAP